MPARRPLVIALILSSLLCVGFGPPVITESDLAQRAITPSQLRAWRHTECPPVTAQAYIVVSPTTGQVLGARDEHVRRAPASLVKIVTALVALEHSRQDDKVMVQWMDVTTYSVTRLLRGQTLSLRELLLALLVGEVLCRAALLDRITPILTGRPRRIPRKGEVPQRQVMIFFGPGHVLLMIGGGLRLLALEVGLRLGGLGIEVGFRLHPVALIA